MALYKANKPLKVRVLIIDAENPACSNYPIQPGHISAEEHFADAFGNYETEVSAYYIVRLCQQKGGWFPFTKEEIDKFSKQNFCFNRLIRDNCDDRYKPVILGEDGKYRVTHIFVSSCFRSSPSPVYLGQS